MNGVFKSMKIDWAKKLSSRKFWMAVAGFVAGLVVIFNGSEQVAETITGSVMSLGAVISYIIGEGLSDSAKGGDNGGS